MTAVVLMTTPCTHKVAWRIRSAPALATMRPVLLLKVLTLLSQRSVSSPDSRAKTAGAAARNECGLKCRRWPANLFEIERKRETLVCIEKTARQHKRGGCKRSDRNFRATHTSRKNKGTEKKRGSYVWRRLRQRFRTGR